MTIEGEIARIATSHTDRNAIHDAVAALPGAVAHETGFVRCQNLEIEVSRAGSDEHGELFRWLRELDIAAAPEFVAYSAGEYEVVVLRYWTCPGEKLVRLADANVKLSQHALARFRSDMERLFDRGKMFAYIRGDAHWLVSETTGAIVLWGWELTDAIPRKREEYFESIERTLARYS